MDQAYVYGPVGQRRVVEAHGPGQVVIYGYDKWQERVYVLAASSEAFAKSVSSDTAMPYSELLNMSFQDREASGI